MSLTLVRFTLGPHECGLAVEDVHEVLWAVAVTALPVAPDFVEGMINRRGTVTPVIDLRKRVGVPAGPYDVDTRIVIASLRGHQVGLIVDGVSDVTEIPDEEVGVDPTEVLGIDLRQYASRVFKTGEGLIVVIDPASILTADEGRRFDAAVAAPGDGA